jgi:cobalt/nickel transport system permease protein
MNKTLPQFLTLPNPQTLPCKKGSVSFSFIDRSVNKIAGLIKTGYIQLENTSSNGLFQKLDSRIKVLFMIFFLIIVSVKKDIFPEVLIFIFTFILSLVSRINLFNYYKRVLVFGFFFGFLVALPSSLNFITKGETIFPILRLNAPIDFWIYHFPAEIGITRQGISGVMLLSMRVINSLSISLLVLHTTKFFDIIKALRIFRAPDSFLMIITITYKYIFIFARTVEDIYLSIKSRVTGSMDSREMRKLVAGRMGFMFKKSRLTCEEVYRAMVSRGFADGIRISSFERLKLLDWMVCFVLLIAGIAIILV